VGQVRDASVAEDLVQETLLAALRGRSAFNGRSSERTWLVGILRHKIYDHLRRSSRERAFRQDGNALRNASDEWDNAVFWLHDVAAECQSPSRRMELSELQEALEAAIGKLPRRLGQVFELYQIDEQPSGEICQRLNISESNLWVLLHRARKALKKQLSGWWDGNYSPNV